MHLRQLVGLAAACVVTVAACSDDATPLGTDTASTDSVATGRPFPAERCAQNRAAGTITYVSGYDYAAAASIVDVLVAEQRGYFDAVCLDVRVRPGLSSDNHVLVASDTVQFASAGSFSEIAEANASATGTSAELVTLAVEGKSAIDTLILRDPSTDLDELAGSTIGVKGALPPSIRAMLADAGLTEGQQYTLTRLNGFDPVEQIAIADIDGITGFLSNEPGQLERAGVTFGTLDPAATGIPGSFGLLYTNRGFFEAHPTAVADFMRASMYALAEAIAEPASASMVAIDFIENNGNPNHLSSDGEAFRWQTESKMIVDSTPDGQPIGVPDEAMLQAEVDAYAAVGLFGGTAPDIESMYDADLVTGLYDVDRRVIWPTT